jgi:hypothetical protein
MRRQGAYKDSCALWSSQTVRRGSSIHLDQPSDLFLTSDTAINLVGKFARLYHDLPSIARLRNLQVLSDYSDASPLSPLVPEPRLISLADRPLKIHCAGASNGDLFITIGCFVRVDGSFRLFGYFDTESKAERLHPEYDKPFED